jgi:hypothetical protein
MTQQLVLLKEMMVLQLLLLLLLLTVMPAPTSKYISIVFDVVFYISMYNSIVTRSQYKVAYLHSTSYMNLCVDSAQRAL